MFSVMGKNRTIQMYEYEKKNSCLNNLSAEFKKFVELTGETIKKHTTDKKLLLGMAIILANFASSGKIFFTFPSYFFVDVAVREILATLDVNDLLTHALKNFEAESADDPQVLQLAAAYAEIVELFGGAGQRVRGNIIEDDESEAEDEDEE